MGITYIDLPYKNLPALHDPTHAIHPLLPVSAPHWWCTRYASRGPPLHQNLHRSFDKPTRTQWFRTAASHQVVLGDAELSSPNRLRSDEDALSANTLAHLFSKIESTPGRGVEMRTSLTHCVKALNIVDMSVNHQAEVVVGFDSTTSAGT